MTYMICYICYAWIKYHAVLMCEIPDLPCYDNISNCFSDLDLTIASVYTVLCLCCYCRDRDVRCSVVAACSYDMLHVVAVSPAVRAAGRHLGQQGDHG